jgi:hypothetical protein
MGEHESRTVAILVIVVISPSGKSTPVRERCKTMRPYTREDRAKLENVLKILVLSSLMFDTELYRCRLEVEAATDFPRKIEQFLLDCISDFMEEVERRFLSFAVRLASGAAPVSMLASRPLHSQPASPCASTLCSHSMNMSASSRQLSPLAACHSRRTPQLGTQLASSEIFFTQTSI